MKGRLEQIKMLEKELRQVNERIETQKKELIEGNLVDEKDSHMSWERDDELAHKEEELKNLEVERDKIQTKLLRLTNV